MAVALGDDDLNGECFILGSAGEIEEDVNLNHIIFPLNFARPAAWLHGSPLDLGALAGNERKKGQAYLALAFWLNYDALAGAVAEPGMTPTFRVALAYMRMLLVREGIVNPEAAAHVHHCRYNDAVFDANGAAIARLLNAAGVAAANVAADYTAASLQYNNGLGANTDAIIDTYRVLGAGDVVANGLLTDAMRLQIRKDFSDVICLLAFMFRVRAHHYLPDMEDRYGELWGKCLKGREKFFGNMLWKHTMTYGLHAIFPDVLDDFWLACIANNRCAGALQKRRDAFPAGCASVAALRSGLDDLRMCLPRVVEHLGEAEAYLKTVEAALAGNRWSGSVNHNFYGVAQMLVDEKKLAAMASFIMAATKTLAAESPLKNSKALLRLANSAPISGNVLTVILQALLTDKDEVKALLAEITL